jgi:hypothetical protein
MRLTLINTNVNIDSLLVQVQGQSSHYIVMSFIILYRAALSNAAPAIYFSGALRKHFIWADY